MRRLFDDELNDIDANFTEMGMMVSETIEKAVKAFIDHDRDLAQEIIDNDAKINQREVELEQKSFEMIALYQPVTSDLREIVTILKAVSELERMADYARNIAHATIRVKGNVRVPEIEAALSEMGNRVRKMVEEMLAAYVKVMIRKHAGSQLKTQKSGRCMIVLMRRGSPRWSAILRRSSVPRIT